MSSRNVRGQSAQVSGPAWAHPRLRTCAHGTAKGVGRRRHPAAGCLRGRRTPRTGLIAGARPDRRQPQAVAVGAAPSARTASATMCPRAAARP